MCLDTATLTAGVETIIPSVRGLRAKLPVFATACTIATDARSRCNLRFVASCVPMNERHLRSTLTFCVLSALLLSACATTQQPVVEKLDENTGVTVTYSKTPFVFSSGETADSFPQIDVVQLGTIEINRMGVLRYFLWLGITEYRYRELQAGRPAPFESINLHLDAEEVVLDVAGWSHDALGTSEPVYRKLFDSSIDAYYPIDLEQIGSMANATEIKFRTADPDAREYTLRFGSDRPAADLSEFYRVVAD